MRTIFHLQYINCVILRIMLRLHRTYWTMKTRKYAIGISNGLKKNELFCFFFVVQNTLCIAVYFEMKKKWVNPWMRLLTLCFQSISYNTNTFIFTNCLQHDGARCEVQEDLDFKYIQFKFYLDRIWVVYVSFRLYPVKPLADEINF